MAESDTSFSKTGEESTSKWSDVIKNSELIATDPVPKYLLKTVKEDLSEDGRVRKYIFGKKAPQKNRKTILIVGESGTGKSALINMMVNYMLGVKWEDDIRFQIIPDEGERLRTESQTTAITAYEIFGLEDLSVPFSLTVIDTPGYGDTEGPETDKSISQNMHTLLKSLVGVPQLNAACLVVKASQNRLYPNQKYIFDAILSLFGKNMEKHILTLITFSNWMPPSNALAAVIESGVPVSKNEDDQAVHFLFDNLPFQKPGKKYEKAHKTAWDNGTESFSEFFQALDEMEIQNLKMTEKVMKGRRKLEDFIQSLESQIKEVEMKRKALEDEKKTLEKNREDMRKNNFQYKYKVVVVKTAAVSSMASCCTVCEVTCHYPCACSDRWFQKTCDVMKDGRCTACPKHCKPEDHKKLNTIYQSQTEERTGTKEGLKKDAEGKITTAEQEITKLEQELKNAEAEKIKLIEKSYQHILRLKELALKYDSDSTRQNIRNLIEMLKKNNDTEKVETLQKMLEKNKDTEKVETLQKMLE